MAADWFTGESGTQTLTMPVDVSALSPMVYLRKQPLIAWTGPITPSSVNATTLQFPWAAQSVPGLYDVEVRCSNGRIFRWTATVA